MNQFFLPIISAFFILEGCVTSFQNKDKVQNNSIQQPAIVFEPLESNYLKLLYIFENKKAQGSHAQEAFILAQEFLKQGQAGKAETLYRHVFAFEPTVVTGEKLFFIYVYHQKFKDAESLASKMHSLFPDNPLAALLYAQILKVTGKLSEREIVLNNSFSKFSDNDAIVMEYMIYLVDKKDLNKAILVGENFIKGNPDTSAIELYLAKLYTSQKNIKLAQKKYENLLKIERNNPVILNSYAYFLEEQNKVTEAEDFFRQAYIIGRDDTLLYSYTDFLIRKKNGEEVVEILEAFTSNLGEEMSATQYPLYLNLGLVYMMKNDFDKAERIFLKMLPYGQGSQKDYVALMLSHIYESHGSFQNQKEILNTILPSSPLYPSALRNKLNADINLSHDSHVLKELSNPRLTEGATEIELIVLSNLWFHYFGRVRALERIQKWKKDKIFLKEFKYLYLNELTIEFLSTKEKKRVIQQMKSLAKENLEDDEIKNSVSYLFAFSKLELDYAEEQLHSLVVKHPENAAYLDSYGWALAQKGKWEKAREVLAKAYTLRPQLPVIAYHYAVVESHFNQKQKVYEVLTEAQTQFKKMSRFSKIIDFDLKNCFSKIEKMLEDHAHSGKE